MIMRSTFIATIALLAIIRLAGFFTEPRLGQVSRKDSSLSSSDIFGNEHFPYPVNASFNSPKDSQAVEVLSKGCRIHMSAIVRQSEID